jgi:hypothetical protein
MRVLLSGTRNHELYLVTSVLFRDSGLVDDDDLQNQVRRALSLSRINSIANLGNVHDLTVTTLNYITTGYSSVARNA